VSKAYVETTVLADALLKPGERASAAMTAIRRFEESELPVYSIKEFKAGPLHHYVWLHGKLVTTNSWRKTLTQLRKMAMSPRTRWVSTAIEALEAVAQKSGGASMQELVTKYGPLATDDVVRCDRYRLTLRSIIMRGWKKRRELTSRVVQELPCYTEGTLTEERGLIEIGETKCYQDCSLAAELRRNPVILEIMKRTVDAQPTKLENVKRSQVLGDLIRGSHSRLSPKQCIALGDAIFAFFCPNNATILTTNERDLRPLAEALGKKTELP
jgi:hypothetical protein